MNRDDIIRMAREAGLCDEEGRDSDSIVITGYLERFAALVAAAERERIKLDTIHSCHSECDKPVCVAVREAVAAEHKAILETVYELAGAEQYRNAMFSDGYDYALGHVKEFIEGRAHEQR